MKIAAVSLVVLALLIGIVPQFTDCLSQGRTIALPNGNTIPMKCHWTAQAEIALAVPLVAIAGMFLVSRGREARRNLSLISALLGGLVILVPTLLIGVCASNTMLCNMLMKPLLILAGTLVMAISLGMALLAGRTPAPVAITSDR